MYCSVDVRLSLGSSMVKASHLSLEGFTFDPCLGFKNRFSLVNLSLMIIHRTSINKVVSTISRPL